MGIASKLISAASRFLALASSAIVAGLLGRFVRHLHNMGFGGGSRVIYTLAISGISIFFALLLLFPFKFTFWSFPLDIAMFILWIVAFGLLAGVRLPPSPVAHSFPLQGAVGGEEERAGS